MDIERNVQENKYFEFRNVSADNYSNAQLPKWIHNEIKNKQLKILDYGCGFGQTMRALKEGGFFNVYGCDIENSAIEYCRKNELNVEKLNLNNIINPFSHKFDVVICTHVIEHIQKDKIISNLEFIRTRFLTDKGILLLSVPNAQSNTGSYWMYEDWTHTTLFTSGSIYYALKAAGYKTIDFLDIDCTLESSALKKIFKIFFLKIYRINKRFWNKVTSSSYHKQSPLIYSYEIKCKAYSSDDL